MTFLAELGLLGNAVGLFISAYLYKIAKSMLDYFSAPNGGGVNDPDAVPQSLIIWGPLSAIFGIGFLFFATRFVKLVWEL
jgi:hypothetical protein